MMSTRRFASFLLLLVALTPAIITVAQTADDLPEFASVEGADVVLSQYDGETITEGIRITLPQEGDYQFVSDLTWSPDGSTLAVVHNSFSNTDAGNTYALHLISATSGELVTLANDLYYLMPVLFSADGSQLIYTREPEAPATPDPNNPMVIPVEVVSIPITGGEPQVLGSFPFSVGCGGGSAYPADSVYATEAGYGGRALILLETAYGIVHSTNCAGYGLNLLNITTGEDVALGDQLSAATLATDGESLIALNGNPFDEGGAQLATVPLADNSVMPLLVSNPPDQLAESLGNIVYSSFTPSGEIVAGSDSEMLANMGFPDGIPVNTVTVASVTSEGEQVLFEGAGYKVGRLLAAPDGTVFFSLVPSGEAWVKALNDNTIPTDITPEEELAQYFPVAFYAVSPDGDVVELLPSFAQAELNAAAFEVE